MTRNKRLQLVWEYLVLTLACVIFAMACECFMIPNGMSAGGMMGLCTIIQYATGGLIQAQYSYIAINAVLIIVAVIAMGIGFGFKTIYCIVVSSLAMELIGKMVALHAVPGSFFYMEERVLIPIVAGLFEAVGLGLVLRYGGSTGGTDIIALMVNKYRNVSPGRMILWMDVVIILSSLLVPSYSADGELLPWTEKITTVVYGFILVVVNSTVIDLYLSGSRQSVQVFILSQKYAEIADMITNDLHRGVTVLDGKGWYTKHDTEVLMVITRKSDLSLLLKMVKTVDPNAFLSVSLVTGVYGKGFDKIKEKIMEKK